jgi:uncharacterized phage protein gp47/JayE
MTDQRRPPAMVPTILNAGGDTSVELLDGWARIAAELGVRSQRVAKEGYLLTASEERSVRELATSIGYQPRPGLAASVFLAYTLEPGAEVRVPAGSSVQTLSRPGERPQTFQTLEALDARARWNSLKLAANVADADLDDRTVLELDELCEGLMPGRPIIVAGTRTDLPGVRGVELAMIGLVEHRTNPAVAAGPAHTFITLSAALTYTYAGAGLRIAANVVRATHGETRSEILGSGNATQARQCFTLRAGPLTFVPAPTPTGARSTLSVHVNGLPWTETSELATAGPADRVYTTLTNDAATIVTFGDGVHGVRLPTAENNVTATYNVGVGAAANVAAQTLSRLESPPAGVQAVSNPLPAWGGTDAESRDDIRRNAPASLLARKRLASLDDFAHYARTFAGVAKATAARIGPGHYGSIHLTLAGQNGAPLDPSGDLAANLSAALRRLADPPQSFALGSFDRVMLLVGASVELTADLDWETVEPAIRAALIATFAFSARDFGQAAFKSEAIAAIARVPGVMNVVVDRFMGVADAAPHQADQCSAGADGVVPQAARRTGASTQAAQIVFLDPSDRSAVQLRQWTGGAR